MTLRFGQNAMRCGFLFLFLFTVPMRLSNSLPLSVFVVSAITLAVMAVSFVWSYWEIVHGHHAYRAQPTTPMRWRGAR
jgi:hypothetical protein